MTNYVKRLTVREIYSSAATLIELYYCPQEEYLTISVICFSMVTYQWRVFHSLEFGTQRSYQNYNNNNKCLISGIILVAFF